MEIEVSEQLSLLCDTRLEGGPAGFAEVVDELSSAEITELFGEAVDALLDAQSKHDREMRRLADRLER